MREQTCCFTGHRRIPPEDVPRLKARLEETILDLFAQGFTNFCAGGALGFDTLAAEAVLRLRDNGFPKLRLILVLPCLNQASRWKEQDVARYEGIKRKADEVIYTGQEYARGCMHKRNRHLVDRSSVCVCYFTQDKGGTAYTVHYAEKHGLDVINVAEK